MCVNATVAGMSRNRTVYFNKWWLDLWFWLRNQHPYLSCFMAPPFHPFERGSRIRFFTVVLIFSIFSSVLTLIHCEDSLIDCEDNLRPIECPAYFECYMPAVTALSLISLTIQAGMEAMVICACMRPGGTFYCCAGMCGEKCTQTGKNGLLVCQVLSGGLLCAAVYLAIYYKVDLVQVIATTIRMKGYSAVAAFVMQAMKWWVYRKCQRKNWENGSTKTNSVYLHEQLPTPRFLVQTDMRCGFCCCSMCVKRVAGGTTGGSELSAPMRHDRDGSPETPPAVRDGGDGGMEAAMARAQAQAEAKLAANT